MSSILLLDEWTRALQTLRDSETVLQEIQHRYQASQQDFFETARQLPHIHPESCTPEMLDRLHARAERMQEILFRAGGLDKLHLQQAQLQAQRDELNRHLEQRRVVAAMLVSFSEADQQWQTMMSQLRQLTIELEEIQEVLERQHQLEQIPDAEMHRYERLARRNKLQQELDEMQSGENLHQKTAQLLKEFAQLLNYNDVGDDALTNLLDPAEHSEETYQLLMARLRLGINRVRQTRTQYEVDLNELNCRFRNLSQEIEDEQTRKQNIEERLTESESIFQQYDDWLKQLLEYDVLDESTVHETSDLIALQQRLKEEVDYLRNVNTLFECEVRELDARRHHVD